MTLSNANTYRPSPLGYGSPRSSPFRRPESPLSPTTFRQVTPSTSPTKGNLIGTSRLNHEPSTPTNPRDNWQSRGRASIDETSTPSLRKDSWTQPSQNMNSNGSLSQLQPGQVRMLRESFQILDRDSDGQVNRDDVVDMLTQLGLPANASSVAKFFPPSQPQTMTLANFLNTIAGTLSALSPSPELLSAFSAFDDDDTGQIDSAELRDALLQTVPEPGERQMSVAEVERVLGGFSGRRAFNTNKGNGLGKRGEVFKYQEFVNSITGSNTNAEAQAGEGPDS